MTGEAVRGVTRPYPIATICGTMRLHRDMLTVGDELTRLGHIVLLPLTRMDCSSLRSPSPVAAGALDALHRAKIDMADVVVFVTQEQRYLRDIDSAALYFGASTCAEWAYAESRDKDIKVVRLHRRGDQEALIWIDRKGLDCPAVALPTSAVATGARAARRVPGVRKARRAVSAHTFRIG